MSFESLKGKTIIHVQGLNVGSDEVLFICSDRTYLRLYHEQKCCESVSVEDVAGLASDILGRRIELAEEVSEPDVEGYSSTWTFYKLATNEGSVTIRWLGSSNGYYSESVDVEVGDAEGIAGMIPPDARVRMDLALEREM
jgi:hypothetical protein